MVKIAEKNLEQMFKNTCIIYKVASFMLICSSVVEKVQGVRLYEQSFE